MYFHNILFLDFCRHILLGIQAFFLSVIVDFATVFKIFMIVRDQRWHLVQRFIKLINIFIYHLILSINLILVLRRLCIGLAKELLRNSLRLGVRVSPS